MRDSEIIICKGINLDLNYENVLSYNESDMVSLCRNNAVYSSTNLSILGAKEKSIDLEIPYGTLMYANYMAYKNPSYGNKWMFAFITDIKYLSDKACRIFYEIDVWSTWYSKFTIEQAFIEREHVSDDTIGKHTIPEGLETGELISTDKVEILDDTSNFYICFGVTEFPDEQLPTTNITRSYGNIYGGLYYFCVNNETNADTIIKMYDHNSKKDAIITIFMIPSSFVSLDTPLTWTMADVGTATVSWVDDGTIPNIEISMPTTINGYTPKNNKLFTSPYIYVNATNNVGTTVPFKYEDSSYVNDITGKKSILFWGEATLTPGLSAKMIPYNYNNIQFNYNYGIMLGKFPLCSWVSDYYVNWLTQNGVNTVIGGVSSVISGGLGIATGLPAGIIGGASTGLLGVYNAIRQFELADLVPNQAKGNVNSGDINFSYQSSGGFSLYNMSIKYEYAKIIDNYFSRFGYKVNEVKQPNLKSRTQFNFIKVGGNDDIIHGDIPSSDLAKINEIFRQGVTIFHNYSNFKNYLISNPIRTN